MHKNIVGQKMLSTSGIGGYLLGLTGGGYILHLAKTRFVTRRILYILINLVIPAILTMCFLNVVYAERSEYVDKYVYINTMQSDEIKKFEQKTVNIANEDIKQIIPGYDPQNIISNIASGGFDFNVYGFLGRAVNYIFKETRRNINILVKLIIIAILGAILRNLQASYLSRGVGEFAFYICYGAIVSILMVSFNECLKLGRDVMDDMVNFMYATVPILITMLVSSGNVTTAGIFRPLLMTLVQVMATTLKGVFIPLIFLSAVLSIVNNISDKIEISKLAGLLKQFAIFALGTVLTLFVAVISVEGTMGTVVDGVTGKTVKFAISTFIPVAGKYLADAADSVVGCTLLIKNAGGIAVMIAIAVICIIPLLKILSLILLHKTTCALLEPIAEKRITNCINEVANSMTFVLGIVATVAFMFFISVTAVITVSNASAMFR